MEIVPDATGRKLTEELPPLSANMAVTEADRCLYCYDAPCTHACPTHIDIPGFIKQIATNNLRGSAETIYASNLMGASCARVCPVQELCEGACVLSVERRSISIGRLQRYTMDHAQAHDFYPKVTSSPTGRRFAVIGAGPAGLSCAGTLALEGHDVTVFERRDLPGGLSTYGIIALREPVAVALDEARMIEGLGVKIRTGVELGSGVSLTELLAEFEAVVLAVGLASTPALDIPGEELILDGLEYVEASKISPESMEIGREVVVIGAGNTAIDCATIAKRMGAERVTMIYRRTAREMTCYEHEYEFALRERIEFRFLSQPVAVHASDGKVAGMDCAQVMLGEPDASGRPRPRVMMDSRSLIMADQIIKAVGQQKHSVGALLGLKLESGYVAVDAEYQTSTPGVYAIGDCIRSKGAASTVMAVEDGKLAAQVLNRRSVKHAAEVL